MLTSRPWKDTGRKWRSNWETKYVLSEDLPFSVQVRAKNKSAKNPVCLLSDYNVLFGQCQLGCQQPLLWLVYRSCPVWLKPISNRLVTMQKEPVTAVLSQSLYSFGTVHQPTYLNPLSWVQNNTLTNQTNKHELITLISTNQILPWAAIQIYFKALYTFGRQLLTQLCLF